MYSQAYLGDETPVTTPPADAPATPVTTQTGAAQPAAPMRQWRRHPRQFSPRQPFTGQIAQQGSNAAGGGQFYDHQMALAAQQNAQQQQPVAAAPESSGIGGISWPVIALAGGGFLMLMMVMMSGKK